MNKIFRIVIIPMVAFVLIAGTLSSNIKPANAAYNVLVGSKTNHDLSKLEHINMKLQPPLQNAKVDVTTAVQNAQSVYPFTTDAKSIDIEYHLVTSSFELLPSKAKAKNPELAAKNAIKSLPAYIISFKGLTLPIVSGGPSINHNIQNDTRQEFNVVVDATSGVPLYAFSYR